MTTKLSDRDQAFSDVAAFVGNTLEQAGATIVRTADRGVALTWQDQPFKVELHETDRGYSVHTPSKITLTFIAKGEIWSGSYSKNNVFRRYINLKNLKLNVKSIIKGFNKVLEHTELLTQEKAAQAIRDAEKRLFINHNIALLEQEFPDLLDSTEAMSTNKHSIKRLCDNLESTRLIYKVFYFKPSIYKNIVFRLEGQYKNITITQLAKIIEVMNDE